MRIAALGLLTTLATAALGGAVACASTPPDPNGNLVGLTTPNGRLVAKFITMWFNDHRATEAFDTYVSRRGYMNHAVYNARAGDQKTFEQEKAEEARAAGPGTHFDIKQIVAEGNLVFVHIAATHGEGGVGPATGVGTPTPSAPPPGGPGPVGDGKGADEMVMILRVDKGKIVDHWDLHVPTNSDSGVFTGLDRKLP